MFAYIWPIAMVILANTAYQICAKCTPADINPFASLIVTYIIGAIVSAILYFALNRDANLVLELKKINWASIVLGFVVVALEVGWIYAYKAGWQVSTAQIIQSAILGMLLIFVGAFLFKETLTLNKIIGILICLVGLAFINVK